MTCSSIPLQTSILQSEEDLKIAKDLVRKATKSGQSGPDGDKNASAVPLVSEKLLQGDASWLYGSSATGDQYLAGLRVVDFYSEFFEGRFGKVEPILSPSLSSLNWQVVNEAQDFISFICAEGKKQALTHLTASVEADDGLMPIALARSNFFLADTVIIYRLAIRQADLLMSDSLIRPAVATDRLPLEEIAEECFGDRKNSVNHFSNDPMFSMAQVRLLYRQWVSRCLDGDLADRVLVYEKGGQLAGFLSVKLPSTKERQTGENIATIPLNAVKPGFQGRGIYKCLVHATINWLKEKDVEYVQIGTQLSGRIHSTWQRLGAKILRSYHQYHFHY